MKYYLLDGLGKHDSDKFCISHTIPDEIDDLDSALDYGGVLTGDTPNNPYDIKMYLDENSPRHTKIGSFVSTADDYVMFHTEVLPALQNFRIDEVEFLPFTLIAHDGTVHSKDYRFVIPRLKLDVLDDDETEIVRDNNGVVIGIDRVVFSKTKLEDAPDMFRVFDLGLMGFSERLVRTLEEKFTNFVFKEVEVI